MQNIVVFGGSGFIGSPLVARLSEAGLSVTVPTRHRERAKHLLPLPTVDVVEVDTFDSATLRRLLQGQDAVVNLVGVLHGRRGRPYGDDFARAHVRLPQKLVAACGATGVRRLLHVSALGADSAGPSMYLRSKGDGEAAVRAAPDLQWTIVRPSVVFGPQDAFLQLFARLQRVLPVMLLGAAQQRLAPVFVGDVAQALAQALVGPQAGRTVGRIYELAGPGVYTLGELVRQVGIWAGVNEGRGRPVLSLPDSLARALAAALEWAPGPTLLSRDNLDSLRVPCVPTGELPGFAPELGVAQPATLDSLAPDWLAGRDSQTHYDLLRASAGR